MEETCKNKRRRRHGLLQAVWAVGAVAFHRALPVRSTSLMRRPRLINRDHKRPHCTRIPIQNCDGVG